MTANIVLVIIEMLDNIMIFPLRQNMMNLSDFIND